MGIITDVTANEAVNIIIFCIMLLFLNFIILQNELLNKINLGVLIREHNGLYRKQTQNKAFWMGSPVKICEDMHGGTLKGLAVHLYYCPSNEYKLFSWGFSQGKHVITGIINGHNDVSF